MKKTKSILLILITLIVASSTVPCLATGPAHMDNIEYDLGGWQQAVAEGSLGVIDPKISKARIWLEGQAREDNSFRNVYQGMARVAMGYQLTDRATIWAGYTYLPGFPVNYSGANTHFPKYVAQQDVWPAFRYVLPTDYGTFTFRTMVEANFLPSNNNEVRYRPRQMLRFMHPFEFEPRLSLITWNETFLIANTTAHGGQSGFNQNRAFVGAGWTFNKNFRFEGGYMNQYLEGAHYSSTSYDHNLIMTSLFINF